MELSQKALQRLQQLAMELSQKALQLPQEPLEQPLEQPLDPWQPEASCVQLRCQLLQLEAQLDAP